MTSMKTFFGLVVVAFAIGCGTETLPETGETTQAVRGCDDPDCLLGNGGGVYTEEIGNAGIGPNDFMIMRFINLTGGGVTLQGRGIEPGTTFYTTRLAGIYFARVDGAGMYQVFSVSERLTAPTFTLAGPNGNFTVTDLTRLQLVLNIDDALYTVSFRNPSSETRHLATIQEVDMWWNAGSVASFTQAAYCTRAPINNGAEDPVVFQQSIIVNPLTAVIVARNSAYVTLSCRHGAIATVRWWGYAYRGDQESTDMFEAAMHMKRASYCGDKSFYTRANTDVLINDTDFVNTDPMTVDTFEASWGRSPNNGPIRALCVNMDNRRHQHANYPPNSSGSDFDSQGNCADGVTHIDVRYQSLGDPPCSFGPLNDQASP